MPVAGPAAQARILLGIPSGPEELSGNQDEEPEGGTGTFAMDTCDDPPVRYPAVSHLRVRTRVEELLPGAMER